MKQIVNRQPLKAWSNKVDELDLDNLSDEEKLALIIEALVALEMSQMDINKN